jgi:hypothetical protein
MPHSDNPGLFKTAIAIKDKPQNKGSKLLSSKLSRATVSHSGKILFFIERSVLQHGLMQQNPALSFCKKLSWQQYK